MRLKNNVRVVTQFWAYAVAHGLQDHFYPFAPHELEGGHKVRIPCDDNNGPHKFTKGQAGHVHADPHIDTLLGQIQIEVRIGEGARGSNEGLSNSGLKAPPRS